MPDELSSSAVAATSAMPPGGMPSMLTLAHPGDPNGDAFCEGSGNAGSDAAMTPKVASPVTGADSVLTLPAQSTTGRQAPAAAAGTPGGAAATLHWWQLETSTLTHAAGTGGSGRSPT